MGAVLGGVGVGLVWGWLVAMVVRPASAARAPSIFLAAFATLLLVAGIYSLAGLPAALGLVCAAGVAALTGIAVRSELERNRKAP